VHRVGPDGSTPRPPTGRPPGAPDPRRRATPSHGPGPPTAPGLVAARPPVVLDPGDRTHERPTGPPTRRPSPGPDRARSDRRPPTGTDGDLGSDDRLDSH